MVDCTELIIITSIVQTVVITLTLVVFIFQFRSQEKSIREAAVANVMGRYTDYVRRLVDKPELASLLDIARTRGQATAKPSKSCLRRNSQSRLTSCWDTASSRRSTLSIRKSGWTRRRGAVVRLPRENLRLTPSSGESTLSLAGTFDKDFQDFVTKVIEDSDRKDKRGKG